ncbi:hypothetical protein EYF80_049402 [Liparis tanakae]|uniref:Uncharacterized protein n=1 Tax=Liparis tanakae TaxID=230148 RepID=A0A4Z2FGX3_9TELE|nr:hypothetical protein EYF80_049402 [Liparis tanakae]
MDGSGARPLVLQRPDTPRADGSGVRARAPISLCASVPSVLECVGEREPPEECGALPSGRRVGNGLFGGSSAGPHHYRLIAHKKSAKCYLRTCEAGGWSGDGAKTPEKLEELNNLNMKEYI